MGFLARFQFIDRRIIYVCVFVIVFGALIVPFPLPMVVSPEVESFYREVENTPDNKVVLIGADWGAGTRAENRPQIAAVIEHLLITKKKFIILGFAQQGPEFTLDLTEELAKKHGRKYGEDFCSFGFKPAGAIDSTLLSLGQSFKGTFARDEKGNKTAEIPMMKNVNSMADVHLIAEVTGSGFMESYLRRVTKPTKIAQGCTGIIGPEQYAYLDSGQLVGLMVGMKGAAEYEAKLRREHPEAGVDPVTKKQLPGDAMIAMRPQSLAHVFIILLIIMGNISVYVARKQAAEKGAKA
ncbi:MAG: hypothetical protein NZT92_20070 [Abditibacteriales bacterium]|nr:hypothetical protein [Abditibacteriales bacterium]